MKKWRSKYFHYFRMRIRDYDKKTARAKKGSRVYEARWRYGFVYRYYYLYGLKRQTWFAGRMLKRYKKGTAGYNAIWKRRSYYISRQVPSPPFGYPACVRGVFPHSRSRASASHFVLCPLHCAPGSDERL